MKYTKAKGNLFKANSSFVLAHCVSRDMALGAGIAKQFRDNFPKMNIDLNANKPKRFPVVVRWEGENRVIYNLVTKERYFNKPTRPSLEKTLIDLKQTMLDHNEKRLAIPLIGAGLDKLSWGLTEKYIKELFSDTEIEVLVCEFTPRRK